MRRAKDGESIEIVYGTTNYWSAFARLENDQAILSNAYLAEHASKPPKHACDHCGAFFRVEVVGVHHPKRGVVMCPFCGNEPKKVEEK